MSSVSEPVSSWPPFVTLRGGTTILLEAVFIVLDLEARGIGLERDGDDVLLLPRHSRVTDEDRALIQKFKPHVLGVIDYVTSAGVQ